jgi:hypothetical protein
MMTIGGLRTLKAVVQDAVTATSASILITDVFILIIFISLSVLIYLGKIRRIPVIFGILLILLLIFSYVQFGGVRGASEYNLMALGVLLVLAYRGKQLIWIMGLLFSLTILASLDLRFNGWLTQNFFKAFSISQDNYITTVVAILVLILYFKSALVAESKRLMLSRTELNDQIKSIQEKHVELEQQQHQLYEVNEKLEKDIEKHTGHIINQNKVIEDYIWLSTESLDAPLQNINSNIDNLNANDYLERRLKDQVAELNLVIHNLKMELSEHGTNQS